MFLSETAGVPGKPRKEQLELIEVVAVPSGTRDQRNDRVIGVFLVSTRKYIRLSVEGVNHEKIVSSSPVGSETGLSHQRVCQKARMYRFALLALAPSGCQPR